MQDYKRSNEELALLIQAGHTELYVDLWEQTERLFYLFSLKYFNRHSEKCAASGIEFDDLLQSCFLSLYDAVTAFKPDAGLKLTSYFNFHVKNRFRELYGTRRNGYDALLNNSYSIDEALPGADDLTLADTIEDVGAADDFIEAEHRIYNKQLHDALGAVLDTLDDMQSEVITKRYYTGKTPLMLSVEMNVPISLVRKTERNALNSMRSGANVRQLQRFLDERLSIYAWHDTGHKAFIEHRVSSVEIAVERAERDWFNRNNSVFGEGTIREQNANKIG